MTRATLFAAAAVLALALPAAAADTAADGPITVTGGFVLVSHEHAMSGAAFMRLENTQQVEDRLVAAASDVAQRVELHTHIEDDQGVMRMVEVEEGFPLPAGGHHDLARGGDHVMFMGLTRPLAEGDSVTLRLEFEQAGVLTLELPVGLPADAPAHHGHGHSHGH